MITADTRERFTCTTSLNVNLKTKKDYLYLTSAAYDTAIEDIDYPSGDIDSYKDWLKRNEDKTIILSMISLYKCVVERLDKLEINLSDEHIQNWIRKNANSVSLARNYRNNLYVVVKELMNGIRVKKISK